MIATSLFSQPWAITRSHFDAMCSAVSDILAADPKAFFLDGMEAPSNDGPGYSVDAGGIATVPIQGVLMQSPDLFEQIFFGAVDMLQVGSSVRAAAQDDSVRGIILNIDSPGGTVMGTPELADSVRGATTQKPVFAFTHGLMASAAYWVGSQADAVYSTPSARVGSIGVIMQIPNRVEQLRKAGVKVETFAAGKYKGAGSPVMELSDEHRAMFTNDVQNIHEEFKAAVNSRRSVAEADMEGQDFPGKLAAEKRLVSGIVPGIEAVHARMANRLP